MSIRVALWCIFCLLFTTLLAQEDEIKRRQRAIFIYNFTQQISWANEREFQTFTVGVLGDDPITGELNRMREQGRTVLGKPLQISSFNSVNQVKDAQLIYLHKRFNFDITELLEKVKGTNTLIISEDYAFHQSMINMIYLDNSFQFEINEDRLKEESFKVSPSLKKLAISSGDRWQALYIESRKSLQEERETVAQQKERLSEQEKLLASQQKKINEQIEQIDARNMEVERLRVEFERLSKQNEEQQSQYDEKEESLKKVEDQLSNQQGEMKQRKDEIDRLDRILLQQMDLLSEQEDQIDQQQGVLSEQRKELNYQRNFTILFIILTLSTITAGFFIWRSYRIKRKSNIELAEKNQAIEAKSKELEAQNEEMEQFAYVASHDLQEPLNTITSIINLIKVEDLDEMGQNSIKFIGDSTNRMRQLIRGLLEFSKLGKDVEFTRVDCNKVIENVKANLSNTIEESNTQLSIAKLPSIQGHEVKLSLLFQNLISNAIKFRSEERDPEIKIALAKKHVDGRSFWQFSVKDNGIGIAEKHQEKVFAIFQRLHSKSKYEGTGIGLAHCKKIVDLHGGSIWVESEEGTGSTFYFTLKSNSRG